MKFYYSGKHPDSQGMIRIHAETCSELPDLMGRIYLGLFANGNLAIEKAQRDLQLPRVKVCSCCR